MTANTVRMSTSKRSRMLFAALTAGALALSGCGSGGTETVSISSAGTSETSTQPTGTTRTTIPSPKPTTPKSTSSSTTNASGGQATRTTTAPAFTKEAAHGEGVSEAVAVVKAHGYTTADTSDYHPEQTLRVLVATNVGSGDGYRQQAFFFVGGHYLGTDTSQPSAGVKVLDQSDTEVTLAYTLYKPHDPLCCSTGGQAIVHFQLNNGRLVPLDPIPPASSKTGTSRQ